MIEAGRSLTNMTIMADARMHLAEDELRASVWTINDDMSTEQGSSEAEFDVGPRPVPARSLHDLYPTTTDYSPRRPLMNSDG